MKGLVITTKKNLRIMEFELPLYASVGKAVGGYIEIAHPRRLPRPYCMVVNEEGLLRHLPVNLFGCFLYESFFHGNPIVGDIVIMKIGYVNGERNLIGLEDDEVNRIAQKIIEFTEGGYSLEEL